MLPKVTNARLGGVRFGRLDAVLDGLAHCGPKTAVTARAFAHDLARAVLRVDGHAHSGRVGDDDAAFGVFLGGRDLHGIVLPLHLYRFGIPVAESEHLVRHVDDVPRLQIGYRLAIGAAARLHVGLVEFALKQGSLFGSEHHTYSSTSSRIHEGKSVSSIASIGASETHCPVPNFSR